MPLVKYRIYELSARAVISYGRQQECAYAFQLSAAETEKCKSLSAPHEQDDNALFYQTMCVLRGDAFTGTPGGAGQCRCRQCGYRWTASDRCRRRAC